VEGTVATWTLLRWLLAQGEGGKEEKEEKRKRRKKKRNGKGKGKEKEKNRGERKNRLSNFLEIVIDNLYLLYYY
jgi:hypothetical protein